jgi:hypothetical protein
MVVGFDLSRESYFDIFVVYLMLIVACSGLLVCLFTVLLVLYHFVSVCFRCLVSFLLWFYSTWVFYRVRLFLFYWNCPYSREEYDDVSRGVSELDNFGVDYLPHNPPEVPGRRRRPFRLNERHRFLGAAARAAKVEFSFPRESEANRLAVSSFIAMWMKERGHRPSFIARDLPLATALTFVPLKVELVASVLRKGNLEVQRRMDMLPEAPPLE